MSLKWIVIGVFALALIGCKAKLPEGKRYPIQGEITALDTSAKTATINAGKIEGWMEAMTMEYPVKPDAEFQKLHVGDHIDATVVVSDPGYYVTDVTVKPKQ
ncbi:MAG TPA: copper-binding protein [Bryobacteraceae bacterium]|nr:copper-binding protein [Bryobacteraceae bacterium]